MKYVLLEECYFGIFQSAIDFDVSEMTPHYGANKKGLEKLEGALERIKESYYRGKFEKAAYLLLTINKGHFFPNGNKRLALILSMYFLYKNDSVHKPISKESYKVWFGKNFGSFRLSKTTFNTVNGWAFYNLNKAIAADQRDFDTLKKLVEEYFRFSME